MFGELFLSLKCRSNVNCLRDNWRFRNPWEHIFNKFSNYQKLIEECWLFIWDVAITYHDTSLIIPYSHQSISMKQHNFEALVYFRGIEKDSRDFLFGLGSPYQSITWQDINHPNHYLRQPTKPRPIFLSLPTPVSHTHTVTLTLFQPLPLFHSLFHFYL